MLLKAQAVGRAIGYDVIFKEDSSSRGLDGH